MSQDLFETTWVRPEEPAPTAVPPPATASKPPLYFLLAPIAAVTVLVAMLFPRSTPPAPCPVAEPPRELGQVRSLLEQGKPDLAVALADLALNARAPQPCPDEQAISLALAGLRYRAAYSLALAVPDRTDPQAGALAVERWQEAEAKAEAQGLSREQRIPAMTTYSEASTSGLWLLARQAFLRAWEQGQVGPSDLRAISSYYATMRNLGGELIRRGGVHREPGLSFVATAADISQVYGLQRGEAMLDLLELTGPDRNAWPPSLQDDLVLQAKRPLSGGTRVSP